MTKVIQISTAANEDNFRLFALLDDGSIWVLFDGGWQEIKVPPRAIVEE